VSEPIISSPLVRREAGRRLTSVVLTGGVVAAAACFVAAILVEALDGTAGVAAVDGAGAPGMTDLRAVLDGLLAPSAWAWAALGCYLLVLTPVAGLMATAIEYYAVGDRRTVLLAAAVMAVLVLSVVVAVLR